MKQYVIKDMSRGTCSSRDDGGPIRDPQKPEMGKFLGCCSVPTKIIKKNEKIVNKNAVFG